MFVTHDDSSRNSKSGEITVWWIFDCFLCQNSSQQTSQLLSKKSALSYDAKSCHYHIKILFFVILEQYYDGINKNIINREKSPVGCRVQIFGDSVYVLLYSSV